MEKFFPSKWKLKGKELRLRRMSQEEALLIGFFPLMAYWLLKGIWVQPLYLSSITLYWTADIFQYVVLPLATLYFVSSYCKLQPSKYGFRRFGLDESYGYLIVLFSFVFAACWVAVIPVRGIAYNFLWQFAGNWEHANAIPKEQPLRAVVGIYLAATAALVEETLFRGLPWLYFNRGKGSQARTGIYIFVTALLFSAIHWWQGPHMLIAAFSFWIVAAALYSKIQNIWPFVFSHFFIDLGIVG